MNQKCWIVEYVQLWEGRREPEERKRGYLVGTRTVCVYFAQDLLCTGWQPISSSSLVQLPQWPPHPYRTHSHLIPACTTVELVGSAIDNNDLVTATTARSDNIKPRRAMRTSFRVQGKKVRESGVLWMMRRRDIDENQKKGYNVRWSTVHLFLFFLV